MMGDEELDQISRVGVILAKLTAFFTKTEFDRPRKGPRIRLI